jgi:myosin heavy subunit
LSQAAFSGLVDSDNNANQAIIISGESGAGKTEAMKKCLQYLTRVAGCGIDSNLQERILQSNVFLEAFGNAKTVRNHNSSRFGKWMEIKFDCDQTICGCVTTSYLLEKGRVVQQAENERNFHVFYQFCAGANASKTQATEQNNFLVEAAKTWHIHAADQYKILNKVHFNNETSDEADFTQLLQSLHSLGLQQDEQLALFRVISALLHLGNLEFEEISEAVTSTRPVVDGVVRVKRQHRHMPDERDELFIAANLLGSSHCLQSREITNVKRSRFTWG